MVSFPKKYQTLLIHLHHLRSHVYGCHLVEVAWRCLTLAGLLMSDPRRPDASCWGWKLDADTVLEKDWAIGLGNAGMHQWTVSVAIDMCFKALVGAVPGHLADIVAAAWPVRKTFKVLLGTNCNVMRHQVQKSVAQANFSLEISRHMEEVIPSGEAFIIQDLQQHVAHAFNWQVSQDHCCRCVVRALAGAAALERADAVAVALAVLWMLRSAVAC